MAEKLDEPKNPSATGGESGTTWKAILRFAWPLIIANSFWNLQLTIDRIFLGMVSTEALGAAMAVMGVFWVPMALLQQTAAYVTTFVAQYYGAREFANIGRSVWQAIYLSLFGGILFCFLVLLSQPFFSWVGHPPDVVALEVAYFNSVSYSALPAALVAVASGYFTGLGQTRTVIGINLVGLVMNAFLDYVMIFGRFGFPAMGVAGAGYATAIATYLAALFGAYLIFVRAHEYKKEILTQWQLDFSLMKQYLRFGVPSGLQWALEGLAFTVFLMVMGNIENGAAALAGSSIAVTIMMLSVLPSMGVAQAVMTIVGQKLGANLPDEAEAATWSGIRIVFIYMFTVAISFYLFPHFYLSWFQNDSNPELWAEVSRITPTILKIVGLFTILDSLYLNFSFAMKGAGDTRFVSLVALTMPWPIMVLPAYLVRGWEEAAIWAWSFALLYSLAITTVLFLRFRKGSWKLMRVI
jgi:MATE family multidrug resistance protein